MWVQAIVAATRQASRARLKIDVIFAKGHVGAVTAVEDQRELFLIADTQQNQGGQAIWVGDHARGVDAFICQGLADEAAHVLVSDTRNNRGSKPKAR